MTKQTTSQVFKKTTNKNKLLSLVLAAAGAFASLTALAAVTDENVKIHELEIEADSEKGAHIIVMADDGTKLEKKMSFAELEDKDNLKALLVDLPEEEQQKILAALDKVQLGMNEVVIHKAGDDTHAKRVMVMNFDSDAEFDSDIEIIEDKQVKVLKKILRAGGDHKVIEIHKQGAGLDAVLHLLKKGEFDADQLDKIQQALDKKR